MQSLCCKQIYPTLNDFSNLSCSAVVRIGDTAVVCGVRKDGEVIANLGLLVSNIKLATNNINGRRVGMLDYD